MNHTPGPWEAHYNGGKDRWDIGNYTTGMKIAAFVPDFQRAGKLEPCEAEQNARLIAAAPELLEACRAMIARFDILTTEEFSQGGEKAERDAMIAAIAAAEGRG